ncbi:uncharacterized protein BCR38DRAFT_238569 [Pseudomassariella vexata]|uniref:Uncharacterized protein n=1 Tax=Pseudomassariella vexata TaxID=1141098 RepID=A0A1Y2DSX4_9PEZI|nr:uncharacterized protein BCR38DRAFT_238569 [Pseudomassariella vexata]ORY62372.1 hypothetical protein BCR38DRAFT_238569 [Pseudomassariella vexata]
MPTPSSNPPPELPPRSYSSSCPDELRVASTSWRPEDNDGIDEMNVDSDETTPPSPVSAPPESSPMGDATIESRFTTESPGPDSESGHLGTASGDTDGPSQSGKPMGTDDDATTRHELMGDATTASAASRRSAAFDVVSPVSADGGQTDDAVTSSRMQEDYYALPLGYNISNVRMRLLTTTIR